MRRKANKYEQRCHLHLASNPHSYYSASAINRRIHDTHQDRYSKALKALREEGEVVKKGNEFKLNPKKAEYKTIQPVNKYISENYLGLPQEGDNAPSSSDTEPFKTLQDWVDHLRPLVWNWSRIAGKKRVIKFIQLLAENPEKPSVAWRFNIKFDKWAIDKNLFIEGQRKGKILPSLYIASYFYYFVPNDNCDPSNVTFLCTHLKKGEKGQELDVKSKSRRR